MKRIELEEKSTYTRIELLQLNDKIKNPVGINGSKLLYGLELNRKKVAKIVAGFDADIVMPMSDEFKKYNDELSDIYKKLALQPDGTYKTKMVNSPNGEIESYDVDINSEAFILERDALIKKHEKVILEREKQISEYYGFLNEKYENPIDFFLVPLTLIPDNIDEHKFNIISFMIAPFSDEQEAEFNRLFNGVN